MSKQCLPAPEFFTMVSSTKTAAKTAAQPKQRPLRSRADARPRDTNATKKLITDAAIRLLAEKGFPGVGVNTLAAQAGVDKQLIYYHFGGLEGVIRHLGSQLEFWLGAPLRAKPGEPYGQAIYRLVMAYATALRQHPLVMRLLAWELVEPTDALKALESTRSEAMAAWVQDLRSTALPAPTDIDAPAINAVLLAGLHYLALREQSIGSFAGMDISTPEGMARIDAAVRTITQRVYTPVERKTP
jgi:AcrR family transcriptional regulator